jgi:transcriptional regulator with PAS, ATPase and Fis domain
MATLAEPSLTDDEGQSHVETKRPGPWGALLDRIAERVAGSSSTVLIIGESGSERECLARAIHAVSPRRSRPFVAVNCAIAETLLESELFGHVRGTFASGSPSKTGGIEQAEGGTLFLDEIGELPRALQGILLRLLRTREYSPAGGGRTLIADVRVIAATDMNLEALVESGDFREDLYYRLNITRLAAPPLAERAL